MKKYTKCEVVYEDEEFDFSIKAIELMINEKGKVYNRAKVKEMERKIFDMEDK